MSCSMMQIGVAAFLVEPHDRSVVRWCSAACCGSTPGRPASRNNDPGVDHQSWGPVSAAFSGVQKPCRPDGRPECSTGQELQHRRRPGAQTRVVLVAIRLRRTRCLHSVSPDCAGGTISGIRRGQVIEWNSCAIGRSATGAWKTAHAASGGDVFAILITVPLVGAGSTPAYVEQGGLARARWDPDQPVTSPFDKQAGAVDGVEAAEMLVKVVTSIMRGCSPVAKQPGGERAACLLGMCPFSGMRTVSDRAVDDFDFAYGRPADSHRRR